MFLGVPDAQTDVVRAVCQGSAEVLGTWGAATHGAGLLTLHAAGLEPRTGHCLRSGIPLPLAAPSD